MTREIFKQLFDAHFESLRKYMYYRCGDAELATDIAQEVFMKIWEKQRKESPPELKALLYKMANDAFISRYRHQKTEQEFKAIVQEEEQSDSPEDAMQYKELQHQYEQALNAMPDIQREVFLLSRMEELKYHEIADRLAISVKAVEKRMKHALQFLRNALATA